MLYAILWAGFSLMLLPRLIPSLVNVAFTLNKTPISWGLVICVAGVIFFLVRGASKK